MALMDIEHKREMAAVEASLSSALSKLSAYEALEVEIDQAVMRIGGAATKNSHQLQVDLLKGIPTCPERRVRQAMHLAQRLLETEQLKENLQLQFTNLKKDYDNAIDEIKSLKLSLSHASKPTSYLVGKLRDEESERLRAQEQIKAYKREVAMYKKKFFSCRKDFNDLQDRLEIILRQKGEMETVKSMLTHLQELNSETDSGSESDSEQGEIMRPEYQVNQNVQHIEPSEIVPKNDFRPDPIVEMARKLGLTPQIVQRMLNHPKQNL